MRLALAAVLVAAAAGAAAREIALDVGHFAAQPGVISASGRAEFEYNRDLALDIRRALQARGLGVRLIGERGNYEVLHQRTRDARGADLLVSVHHDSVREALLGRAGEFAGFSLFVSRRNRRLHEGLACASAIGGALRERGFAPSLYHADPVLGENRPFADRQNGVHYFDNLAVAWTGPMPSLLLEAGVIVNPAEDARMRDPAVRERIAAAVADGVRRCLGGRN